MDSGGNRIVCFSEELLAELSAFHSVFLVMCIYKTRIMKENSQDEFSWKLGGYTAAGIIHHKHQFSGITPDTVVVQVIVGGKEYL